MKEYNCLLQIAGIKIKFTSPFPLTMQGCLLKIFAGDFPSDTEDASYLIRITEKERQFYSDIVFDNGFLIIYKEENYFARKMSIFVGTKKKNICLLREGENKFILEMDEETAKCFCSSNRIINYLAFEELLLSHDAFILHSVIVEKNGSAVMFSGNSGTGKSTQGGLWQDYLGAEIINGDRGIIRKINGKYFACGSPFSGSSAIYKNKCVPVSAIAFIEKAGENRVYEIPAHRKCGYFLNYSTINSWNEKFTKKFVEIIEDVISCDIKIVKYECNMEREAAEALNNYIYNGGG